MNICYSGTSNSCYYRSTFYSEYISKISYSFRRWGNVTESNLDSGIQVATTNDDGNPQSYIISLKSPLSFIYLHNRNRLSMKTEYSKTCWWTSCRTKRWFWHKLKETIYQCFIASPNSDPPFPLFQIIDDLRMEFIFPSDLLSQQQFPAPDCNFIH